MDWERVVNRIIHLHLVSDSTGETIEKIADACLAQFENVEVHTYTHTMVLRPARFEALLKAIETNPGPVLYTIVDRTLAAKLDNGCRHLGVSCIDALFGVLTQLAIDIGQSARGLPGQQHQLDDSYFHRIDAMQFTLAHDDGQGTERLCEAEVVLVGVSRTSKTPTSMYLANHRGVRAANVPFVPGVELPDLLMSGNGPFVVGLTTSAERLVQIRKNRMAALGEQNRTDYVDPDQVKQEILEARRLFTRMHWPVIDVSRRSIEETAAEITNLYNSWKESKVATAAGSESAT
jgi:regulator of PEP synthase PpsR (kinase-PPPase family)